jgi:site-specific DNA-methyltransferase (adenine-specific)
MSHQRKSKIVTPKDEWGTPQWLFDLLDREFHFSLDAAASGENRKCGAYFDKFVSGLDHEWTRLSATYLNPPYSAGNIDKFMQKAYEESQKGALVVCLVPVSGDRWWIDWALKAQEIRYIRGRVKFVGYDIDGNPVNGSPMFSSCVVIFWPKEPEAINDPPVIGKTIEQPKKGSVKA